MSHQTRKDLPTMKIGEVADTLRTSQRALRFYDQEGLITPHRSPKGTRRYSVADLERFRAILLLGEFGVPVRQMKRLATLRSTSSTGNESSRQVAALLAELEHTAKERIAQYYDFIRDLNSASVLVKKCFGCRRRPNLKNCDACSVGKALPSSQVLKLVWDERRPTDG